MLTLSRDSATGHGWQLDWLNFTAAQLAPWWGRDIRWEPIHHDDLVTIEVAPADAPLAMKPEPPVPPPAAGSRAARVIGRPDIA